MYDRTRIKICGLQTEYDVETAIKAGADAVGFIFIKDSPRYISPDDAADLVCQLPPLMDPIGVFADCPPREVAQMATDAFVEIIQLHGHETLDEVEALQTDFAIIRGTKFGTSTFHQWKASPLIDMLLVDGSTGGQGTQFNWEALTQETPEITKPIILAGGLTPQNVGSAINRAHPFAVDVSSGVETEQGRKDAQLIRSFCAAVREADYRNLQ